MTMPAMTKTLLLAAALLVGTARHEAPARAPPVTVPTAARLAFTVQPSNATAGVAISPPVTVTIQDASGNPMTNATDRVTVALRTTASGGTLSGTTAVHAGNVVAPVRTTATQLRSPGYTRTPSSGTWTGATSAAFAIAPAAAAKVAFAVQPSTTDVAQPITPAVQVAIQDAFGNTVTGATNAVTLTLATNPGSGTLVGTKTVNAVGGIATFSGLSIDKAGTGYTLAATSVILAAATSAAFDITLPLTFAAVSAGDYHTCGVTTAGTAYCWGDNTHGELGDGTGTDRTSPVAVEGGLTFASVSAGLAHTCGVTTGGAAYCWGYNADGQLGEGTGTDRTSPVAVLGGVTFAAVSAGGYHTCGVTTAGTAYCWGRGLLGDGTLRITNGPTSPVAVRGGLTFAVVIAGRYHTCGVTTAGLACCWGENLDGELGYGTTTSRTSPVAVLGGLSFARVSAGVAHTCGVTTGGAAYCWGYNAAGELGDGTTTDRLSPVRVK